MEKELRQIIREEIKNQLNEAKDKKLSSDIKFVKRVAADYGHRITDEEAKKAIKICGNDYYKLKDYFLN